MKIDFEDIKFYPLNDNIKQAYKAIGYINLYNMDNEIAGTILVNIPRCLYDKDNQTLICLKYTEGDADE